MRNRLIAVAGVVVAASVSGCTQPQSMPRMAAHLTIDGSSHETRPPTCSQEQAYRTIDISDRGGHVEAVVLLSGYRAVPQWVKIRDIDGFTGSYWKGGVGEAHAEVTNDAYTISGNAYGMNSSNPNKVVTTGFTITAKC
ncbi:lipoprotein LpqH [Mycobacterium sp. Lab-001]|uniref:lipoprotein LpqH n=1 Tax=Mycobacterium sp. Lab-001 TaxID=3410136 RepID=UPI003D17994A